MTDPKNKLGALREFFTHHPNNQEVYLADGQCFYTHSDAANHGLTVGEKPAKWTRMMFEAAEKVAKKPATKAAEKPAEVDNDNPPREGEAQTSPVDEGEGADAPTPKADEATEAAVEVVRSENPDLTDVENRGRTTQPKSRTTKAKAKAKAK